jgi:hypothetical protein
MEVNGRILIRGTYSPSIFLQGLRKTPAILPAGFQVNIHYIDIDYFVKFRPLFRRMMRRKSIVGTATRYGLDGPGFEPRWVEIFLQSSHRFWNLHSLLYNE